MFRIDPGSSRPIYEQIVSNVKENVIRGYFSPGDALPSVRKLAQQLSVTPNTVAKAYQELERERVIETRPGKGAYISGHISGSRREETAEEVRKRLKPSILELKYIGISEEEVLAMVAEIYEELK